MSLKVIIKVDTVITAAERERDRPPWRVTCVGWPGQLEQEQGPPPHMCGVHLASRAWSESRDHQGPPVKQNSTPGAAINLLSHRTRSILA